MLIAVSFGALMALSSTALAQDTRGKNSVLVWVEKDLPEEKLQKKAGKIIGGDIKVYTGHDLAFPPQPRDDADKKAYDDLDRAVRRSRERWDDFDVELSIAQEVQGALEPIGIIESEDDRARVVEALLLIGASVDLAFLPPDLKSSSDAAAFRIEMPGVVANRALVEAVALAPEFRYTRAEVANAATAEVLEQLQEDWQGYAHGVLDTTDMPPGTTLVINARPQESPGHRVELGPGHYWIYFDRDGLVTGRGEVDILPGLAVELPRLVDDRELAQADRRVSVGAFDGLPNDVITGVDLLAAQHPGREVYLAALDANGRVQVVPYSEGAEVIEKQAITFTVGAEVGGGAVGTPNFRFTTDRHGVNTDTTMVFAGAANGAFDLELGIYNFALIGGAEVHITPTETLAFGTGEDGATKADNGSTPVYLKAHGGAGAYVIRPNQYKQATLLVGATYGWFSPGHLGYGGRVTVGIPMGIGSWFKVSLHGYYGDEMEGYPPNRPLLAAGMRVGFQSSF